MSYCERNLQNMWDSLDSTLISYLLHYLVNENWFGYSSKLRLLGDTLMVFSRLPLHRRMDLTPFVYATLSLIYLCLSKEITQTSFFLKVYGCFLLIFKNTSVPFELCRISKHFEPVSHLSMVTSLVKSCRRCHDER